MRQITHLLSVSKLFSTSPSVDLQTQYPPPSHARDQTSREPCAPRCQVTIIEEDNLAAPALLQCDSIHGYLPTNLQTHGKDVKSKTRKVYNYQLIVLLLEAQFKNPVPVRSLYQRERPYQKFLPVYCLLSSPSAASTWPQDPGQRGSLILVDGFPNADGNWHQH